MKKQQAIDLFGNATKLADAIGINLSAISDWPEELSDRISDRVIAASVRADMDYQRIRLLALRGRQKRKAA